MKPNRLPGLVIVLLLVGVCARADDVGISSARLIEESPGAYLLEVDTAAMLVPAFRAPVVPSRFEVVGKPEQERVGAGLQIRYRFAAPDAQLVPGEALLLPWSRTGISLTVRWADGEVRRGLFARGPAGIRVPVSALRSIETPVSDVVASNVGLGATDGLTSLGQWLLMLAVVLAAGRGGFATLVWLAGGYGLALPAVDLGLPALPLEVAEVLVALAAVLVARQAFVAEASRGRLGPLLLLVGFVQATSYAAVVPVDRLSAVLGFGAGCLALAVGQMAMLAMLVDRWGRPRSRDVIGRVVGSLAVAVALAILLQGSSNAAALRAANPPPLDSFVMPDVIAASTVGRPAPPRALDEPVVVFLNIEPYAVRLEILLRVSDLAGLDEQIPIADQGPLVDGLLDVFERGTSLAVDGEPSEPAQRRGDFVTVSAGGVLTRSEPVVESVNDAVLGITYVHDTDGLPDAVDFTFDLFAPIVPGVSATWTDPLGARQQELRPEAPTLAWRSRLAGFEPPAIEPVTVQPPRVPLVSLALLVAAIGLAIWRSRRSQVAWLRPVTTAALVTGCLLYPFARVPLAGPLTAAWQLDESRATVVVDDLLTNVYRSFDLRQEEAIYDRLAQTVAGAQLTEIYLQSRRALELENRGGARGRVDDVEILEVHGVDGLVADVTWKVSGSVSHFGHTHYRQNRNRAEITLEPVDGIWKIVGIAIIDEQRVL